MATWERSIQSAKAPSSPAHTGCHHLSMARRHSLSQQMRGLSERAPQFLRGSGEGGSRHARLWFLPAILLLVHPGPDCSAFGLEKENDQSSEVCFSFSDLICIARFSLMLDLSYMFFWFRIKRVIFSEDHICIC